MTKNINKRREKIMNKTNILLIILIISVICVGIAVCMNMNKEKTVVINKTMNNTTNKTINNTVEQVNSDSTTQQSTNNNQATQDSNNNGKSVAEQAREEANAYSQRIGSSDEVAQKRADGWAYYAEHGEPAPW